MFTKEFAMDAAERAIKTFCQFIMALVGIVAPANGMDLLTLNWAQILLAASAGAFLSIVFSIASSLKGNRNSASLVD